MNTINVKEASAVYSGTVEVKYKKSGKTYKVIKKHNSSKPALFEYMLYRLCGDPAGKLELRPGKINVLDGESSVITDLVVYSESYISTSSESLTTLTYEFLVPDTYIRQSSYDKLQLCSYSGHLGSSTVYAEVEFDTEQQIPDNSNIEIKWTLVLTDANKVNSNNTEEV